MNIRRPWTAEDDEALKTLAPTMSLQRIAVRLKRSKIAVSDRARLFGVKFKEQQRFVPTAADLKEWGRRST